MRLSFTLVFPLTLALLACGPSTRTTLVRRDAIRSLSLRSTTTTPQGHLVWAWLPEAVYGAFRSHQLRDTHVVELLSQMRVASGQRLGPASTTVQVEGRAETGGYLIAFQPDGEDLLTAVMGGPSPRQWIGWSDLANGAASSVDVTLAQGEARERRERCEGERRELVTLPSPEVRGSIGNDTQRRICVMLPQDYASTDRHFPVVYLLPGYGGDHTVYTHLMNENAGAILVGVDGTTKFGATYFRNSAFGGAWETFIERVVSTIDRRYRTADDSAHRALLGHSSGGYNAISLLLRRMDLFGAAAASSPDGLDFERWLFDHSRARATWMAWARIEDALRGPGQMVSYAVQFNDSQIGSIRWPFDLQTGERCLPIWRRWRRLQPTSLLDNPEIRDAARRNLQGRIFISVGTRDAFGLFDPAEQFHQQLRAAQITHGWEPTDDGHFEGSAERRARGLHYIVRAMGGDEPTSAQASR